MPILGLNRRINAELVAEEDPNFIADRIVTTYMNKQAEMYDEPQFDEPIPTDPQAEYLFEQLASAIIGQMRQILYTNVQPKFADGSISNLLSLYANLTTAYAVYILPIVNKNTLFKRQVFKRLDEIASVADALASRTTDQELKHTLESIRTNTLNRQLKPVQGNVPSAVNIYAKPAQEGVMGGPPRPPNQDYGVPFPDDVPPQFPREAPQRFAPYQDFDFPAGFDFGQGYAPPQAPSWENGFVPQGVPVFPAQEQQQQQQQQQQQGQAEQQGLEILPDGLDFNKRMRDRLNDYIERLDPLRRGQAQSLMQETASTKKTRDALLRYSQQVSEPTTQDLNEMERVLNQFLKVSRVDKRTDELFKLINDPEINKSLIKFVLLDLSPEIFNRLGMRNRVIRQLSNDLGRTKRRGPVYDDEEKVGVPTQIPRAEVPIPADSDELPPRRSRRQRDLPQKETEENPPTLEREPNEKKKLLRRLGTIYSGLTEEQKDRFESEMADLFGDANLNNLTASELNEALRSIVDIRDRSSSVRAEEDDGYDTAQEGSGKKKKRMTQTQLKKVLSALK